MTLFFVISKILAFLLNPLFWIGILLLGALFLKKNNRGRKCLIAAVILFFVFTNNFLIDMLLRGWEIDLVSTEKLDKSYDVGVVLGGGMVNIDRTHNRKIFRNNTDRFLQALDLFNHKRINRILISSGAGSILFRDVVESDLIKDFLIDNNVPDSLVLVDAKSDNTHENALFTKALLEKLKIKKVLLITSASHMRRAKACFQKIGVEVDVYPTDKLVSVWRFDPEYLLIPNFGALKRWDTLIHELVGLITYKFMGYI